MGGTIYIDENALISITDSSFSNKNTNIFATGGVLFT
jgi:hypothetical protein